MVEERREERRRRTDITEGRIEDKLDALANQLHQHMADEEIQIADIKQSIEKYFGEIDAHVHKYHHEYIDEEIEHKKENKQWWDKLKQGVAEKIILVLLGALTAYVGGVVWADVTKTEHKPAIVGQNVAKKTN